MTGRVCLVGAIVALSPVLAGCDGWITRIDDSTAPRDRAQDAETSPAEMAPPPRDEAAAAPPEGEGPLAVVTGSRVRTASVPPAANADYPADMMALFATSPVPVLGPQSGSLPQGTSFANRFRVTDDGYFSQMTTEYGATSISGTLRFARRPDAPPAASDYPMRVDSTVNGVSIAFGRMASDYLVEIECQDAACPSEEAARALIDELVVLGGGG